MRAAATPPRRPPSGGLGTVCPPPPSRCTRRKGSQCQWEKRRRGAKAPLRPVIWRGGDPSSPEKKPKADAEVEMNGRRGGSIWRRMKRCRMRWWRWAGDRWRGHGGGAAPAQPPWRVSRRRPTSSSTASSPRWSPASSAYCCHSGRHHHHLYRPKAARSESGAPTSKREESSRSGTRWRYLLLQ